MSLVNLPPMKVPPKLLADNEVANYFEELTFVVYQLYLRTGGGDDIESGVNNVVVTTGITSTDSPYTVTDKYARILVDASSAPVTVNLKAVASDVYCDVIKVDSSANVVTVSSTDNINGQATQELLYQYESIEMAGESEYVVI